MNTELLGRTDRATLRKGVGKWRVFINANKRSVLRAANKLAARRTLRLLFMSFVYGR